jgi:integrase
VFVNLAILDAWQANPEHVDPRYHATSITHAFERACRQSGVTHATFHDLRHTFAPHAMRAGRAGIDYRQIMAVIGQKTMAVFELGNTIDRQARQAAIRPGDTTLEAMDALVLGGTVQSIDNTGMGR